MAKVKILADRVSITSEILTDENLERVLNLCPSVLSFIDENTDEVLYQVAAGKECNSFSSFGATFKDGKSLGNISNDVMELEADARETKIKNILAGVLTKINVIEQQVKDYLEDAPSFDRDIEFVD